jgi:hypothetical protein
MTKVIILSFYFVLFRIKGYKRKSRLREGQLRDSWLNWTDADWEVCSWYWQLFARGNADRLLFVTSNKCIQIKNTLGWSAVVFCECEIITGAHPPGTGCQATVPHPKFKFKKQIFRDYINSFTIFTLRPKSAAEIGWWRVYRNLKK